MPSKPRRWLAYTIELNDLLPNYSEILDRFEASDIPLDGAFGSNTERGTTMPGLLLAIGPGVEPARLLEVCELLEGLGQLFLRIYGEGEHSKGILIGALNLFHDPVVAIGDRLLDALSKPGATAACLARAVAEEAEVEVLPAREVPPGSND